MGFHQYTGGAELAKELGLTASYVSRMFRSGLTADQLRAKAKQTGGISPQKMAQKKRFAAKKTAGLVTSGPGEYVPPRGRRVESRVSQQKGEQQNSQSRKEAERLGQSRVQQLPPSNKQRIESDDDPIDFEAGETGVENYYKAKERKESALADEREIIVAQKRGLLVYRSSVDIWVQGMILKARNTLLRIGPDLQDRLAMETVPAKCGKLVTDEVMMALEGLGKYDG